ncbi:hypothetical protein EYF80_000415 [Liparis tanakae]|uniref:Uncharacterized protein n=1 Tax=Liparis tanakae TaxID=230148 RepID=A0A4Z2JGP5_9TELE|nr:hypothetical protein EYF80_000415 [Liparis tanakae]
MLRIALKERGDAVETFESRRLTPPADWCYFLNKEGEQGANMAPRQRVCHSVANARLISRLMSPREEKDVPLLPLSHYCKFSCNYDEKVSD